MAAGKRYSAGAIFLQVVPVFANVQRAIEDEAKNIDRALGENMEKAGDKAGRRAGKAAAKSMNEEMEKASKDVSGSFERDFRRNVEGINKALGDIDIKRLSNGMRKELTDVKKEIASLGDVDITAEANFKKAYAEIEVLKGRLLGIRDETKIVFRADIDNALKGFGKIEAAKEAISDPIDIEVRTAAAEREMSKFEERFKKTTKKAADALSGNISTAVHRVRKDLDSLGDLRIGVDISATRARAELKKIEADLKTLSKDKKLAIDIDTKAGLAGALAEVGALNLALDKIDNKDVTVDVKTNAKKAAADADAAANSFRSFNIILFAAVSAGPALIPILAGIGGALLAIGPAAAVAGAGLASVLVGFSGIGDALTALGNQQDQAGKTAQSSAQSQVGAARAIADAQDALADARRNAARAAEDAAERVKDAREAAADAVETALERQKEAQEDYRDAVEGVKDAEEDLRQAREDARKDAESLAKRQRQNAVDERQAVLDLGEAQNNYNNVMADGSATNTDREQASVNLEQAQIALNDTRDEQVALADEAADYAANGVDGSEKVKDAQDAVTAAIEAQKDAQEEVKKAAEDTRDAQIDGAKAVQRALEDQRETMSDNKRAIEDAQKALKRARQDAVADLGAIDSQAQAVQAAFDKLGPAGREFALFLFGLRSGFYAFRDDIQKVMLPAIQEAIEGFIGSENAGKVRNVFISLAEGFGNFVKLVSKSLQGPAFGKFFDMLNLLGPGIQAAYGKAFISVLEGIASVLTVAAPFALRFARGLEKMMDRFANWAKSKKGADDIRGFIGYVEEVGPKVLDFFGGLARALGAAARAMAPYGEVILGVIDGLLDFIANMDQKYLSAFLGAITVVLVSLQTAYAVQNIIKAAGALFATAIGPWVFLIIGIAAALVFLYKTNDKFRKFVQDAWERLAPVIKKAYDDYIKPALEDFMDAVKRLWNEVLLPFLEWAGPKIVWLAEKIIPLIAEYIGHVLTKSTKAIDALIWLIKNIVAGVRWTVEKVKHWWDVAVDAVDWVKTSFQKAFKGIKDAWDAVGTKVKNVWDNTIGAVFTYITDTALPALESGFKTTLDNIGKLWDGLKSLVAAPVRFIIEDVINGGLIAGFNKVAGWVGADGLDDLAVPSWAQDKPNKKAAYATGGIMPGYTPGRDVHRFVSPTGGQLDLSGGEAVMRPEWTAAMGTGYVNQMNHLARTGGTDAIKRAMYGDMGGYWLGGVLPLPGASVKSHGSSYSYPAFDMNWGGGYDDYGKAILAWKDGIAHPFDYGSDYSYGRGQQIDHGNGQTSLYAHMSRVLTELAGQRVRAGQTIGYVGDYGNTGTPPTSHLHFEIRGGGADLTDAILHDVEPKHPKVPTWLKGIIRDPLGAFKDWATAPLKAAGSFADTGFFKTAAAVPKMLGEKFTDKVWDIIPGWAKTAVGYASTASDWAVGGLKAGAGQAVETGAGIVADVAQGAHAVGNFLGFADGGILPYNGTMKYDAGGYLPPGMTTVMNLTGKPEPVFTADQFDGMSIGDGGNVDQSLHFHEVMVDADSIMEKARFEQRRQRLEGRYGRNR